jgi:hypothetical protein
MMSISLKAKGRWSQTSESTDLAWVHNPQFSRVKRVIRQDWSSLVVTRMVCGCDDISLDDEKTAISSRYNRVERKTLTSGVLPSFDVPCFPAGERAPVNGNQLWKSQSIQG